MSEYAKQYYLDNKDKLLARSKQWYRDNKERARATKRKIRYGITEDEYAVLWNKQGGVCAICGRVCELCVDHDHQTGKIRGLLCPACNKGLGYFKDDETFLQKATKYVQEHESTP